MPRPGPPASTVFNWVLHSTYEPCLVDSLGHALLVSSISSDSCNLFCSTLQRESLNSKGTDPMAPSNLDSHHMMSACGSLHHLPSAAGGSLPDDWPRYSRISFGIISLFLLCFLFVCLLFRFICQSCLVLPWVSGLSLAMKAM